MKSNGTNEQVGFFFRDICKLKSVICVIRVDIFRIVARSLKNIIGIMKVWYEMKLSRFIIGVVVGLYGIVSNTAFSQDTSGIIWKNPRVGMSSARIGNKLFLIGGAAPAAQTMRGENELESLVGTSFVDAFDFNTNTWDTTIAPMDTPRVYATAVALDDSIYVMGGVDARGNILKSVEVYDPTKNSWRYTTDMLFRRKGAASVVYGDSIFVFGGAGQFNALHHTVEVYSPATGVWSLADTLLWGRVFHHAVKIGKYIYVFGGLGSLLGSIVSPIKYIEKYDPENGSLQIGLTLANPRLFFAVIIKNDSVFLISGLGATDDYYIGADLLSLGSYSAASQSTSKVKLSTPRAAFVADTGNNGMIYIFGGLSPDYKQGQLPVPSVEIVPLSDTPVTVVQSKENVNPQDFELSQNYPNPFNPSTTIEFQVPQPGSLVRLEVFSPLGQKVATLVDKFMEGGRHSAIFAGANLPSGAYIYRLQTESGIIYRKMVLIK